MLRASDTWHLPPQESGVRRIQWVSARLLRIIYIDGTECELHGTEEEISRIAAFLEAQRTAWESMVLSLHGATLPAWYTTRETAEPHTQRFVVAHRAEMYHVVNECENPVVRTYCGVPLPGAVPWEHRVYANADRKEPEVLNEEPTATHRICRRCEMRWKNHGRDSA